MDGLCLGVCVCGLGFEAGAKVVGGGSAMEPYLLWIELQMSHCGGGEAEITGFGKARCNDVPYLEMLERCGHS